MTSKDHTGLSERNISLYFGKNPGKEYNAIRRTSDKAGGEGDRTSEVLERVRVEKRRRRLNDGALYLQALRVQIENTIRMVF